MKTQTVTFTDNGFYCKHKSGWYKTVTFKWFIFNFRKRVFLCLDCENIISL